MIGSGVFLLPSSLAPYGGIGIANPNAQGNTPAAEKSRRKWVRDTPGGRLIEEAGPTEAEKRATEEAERKAVAPLKREIAQLEGLAATGTPLPSSF